MSTADTSEDTVKLNLRLPAELHKKLKDKARREGRSLNAQAIQLFRDGLAHPRRRASDRLVVR